MWPRGTPDANLIIIHKKSKSEIGRCQTLEHMVLIHVIPTETLHRGKPFLVSSLNISPPLNVRIGPTPAMKKFPAHQIESDDTNHLNRISSDMLHQLVRDRPNTFRSFPGRCVYRSMKADRRCYSLYHRQDPQQGASEIESQVANGMAIHSKHSRCPVHQRQKPKTGARGEPEPPAALGAGQHSIQVQNFKR
jgi:hypothetical protein